jgi:biopolymer transport protein ExbD
MARKRVRAKEADELNLIPIMNLVTILIPFLLMAASFISLAVIDTTLPAIGDPTPQEEEPDKPPLNLSVVITDSGFTVLGAIEHILHPEGVPEKPEPVEGQKPEPTIPCVIDGCVSPDDYDYKELVRLLNLIKDDYLEDENVILVPEASVPYEVMIRTMDATREDLERDPESTEEGAHDLFPFVVIAGGAD